MRQPEGEDGSAAELALDVEFGRVEIRDLWAIVRPHAFATWGRKKLSL